MKIGKCRMSQFIDVVDTSLDDGYRAMSSDKEREVEAVEWCNAFSGDMADVKK